MSIVKTRIPILRNGDQLTADEFMLRYERMPGVTAELIEGVVHVASPVSWNHGESHADLGVLLGIYRAKTPGVSLGNNATIRLATRTVPQPDLTLLILPSHGGRTTLSAKGYVEGAPELVVEISYSTASLDAKSKKQAYLAAGVDEYILYRVEDEAIDWFHIVNGEYVPLVADADGLTRSRIFPGLALDLAAILAGDTTTAVARLQAELSTRS